MSYTRTSEDAKKLMQQAQNMAGKSPGIIYIDKLRAYLEGIEQTFGSDTEHRQGIPFDVESGNNCIERFHSTLKERTKVMRGLRTMATAKRFLDGWLVHYNYFRPHMSLKDKTPAEAAGIKSSLHNWKDVVNQPYQTTARIPMKEYKVRELDIVESGIKKPVKRSTLSKRKLIANRVNKTDSYNNLPNANLGVKMDGRRMD